MKNQSNIQQFTLLAPAKDTCQVCATEHRPEEPHNKQSIFYQIKFQAQHGRWPTWTDAMSHCQPDMKAAWTAELKARGEVIE